MRTRVVRGIAAATRLKQAAIRKRYYSRRATVRKQKVRISVYTRDVSAISQFTPGRRKTLIEGRGTNRKGVRVAGRQIDSAFVARGRQNNLQVFKRRGKERLKIDKQAFRIQEEAVLITDRVARRVMKSEYPRLLKQDLKFRLGRLRA